MSADPLSPELWRVQDVVREGPDTATLALTPADGALPPFRPGQFNMLYAFGVGEIAISLSGDPADGRRFVHTVRGVGAVSKAIVGLGSGGAIGLRGPFGTAWPVEAAEGRDVVIVAGGLGLAPLRPAILHLLGAREKFGRVVILIGMRDPDAILYEGEIERWRAHLDVEIEVTVDRANRDWHGNVGVVPGLIPRMTFDPAGTIAMVCGPEIMMRFTVNALRDAGLPPEHVYLSMERNMKCAIGLCGHCQFGPDFVCKDGPIFSYDRIAGIFPVREV